MNIPLFLILLFALQGLCLLVGTLSYRKALNQEDYFLAGRSVKFFPLMMSYVATQIGGGIILGASEEAFQYGWAVLLYPLGSVFGFFLLASGIGRRMAQFKVGTVAQVFEVAYGSTNLKKVAATLSVISLFFILVAQVIASKKFMVSLGLEGDAIFIAFWGIVVLYTVLGGFRAVVATDMIQALFYMAVFFFGFGYILNNSTMSLGEIAITGTSMGTLDLDASRLSGWLLMPMLYMVIEQDMAQRCFAAESPPMVSKAVGSAALFVMLICIIPVFTGVLGKSLGIIPQGGASIFITVIKAATNPYISAFVAAAVLAAIISTSISLINAISSNVSQDFSSSLSLKTSKGITLLIPLLGIAISYSFTNVVDLLILSYELTVSCLFIPIMGIILGKAGSKKAAAIAIFLGAVGFIIFRIISPPIPKEIASVLLSFAGYILTKKIEQQKSLIVIK